MKTIEQIQFEHLFIMVSDGINEKGNQFDDYKSAMAYFKKKEPYNLKLIYRLIACLVIAQSMTTKEKPSNIESYYNDIKFFNGLLEKYNIAQAKREDHEESFELLTGILNKEIKQFKFTDSKDITYFLTFY